MSQKCMIKISLKIIFGIMHKQDQDNVLISCWHYIEWGESEILYCIGDPFSFSD